MTTPTPSVVQLNALVGSTCTVIREGRMFHECQLPSSTQRDRLGRGAVIRCTCGRRYVAQLLSPSFGLVWSRRILPWPRKAPTP